MPQFHRYFGIDYSGAKTPDCSLPGLRLYCATPAQPPAEILPPPGPRKYWTRRGLAHWLANTLADGPPTLTGIDHAFSFPLRYFESHGIPPDWPAFLDDFQHHWPTDEKNTSVDFIRHGVMGHGRARTGSARWRRLTEERSRAKSVFHFDVPGSVAKSTHAGLPWLRDLRQQLAKNLHFWPFDGWSPPSGCHVIAEVYPSLWSRSFPGEDRDPHQQDAYSIARWMRETDAAGGLSRYFQLSLTPINDKPRRKSASRKSRQIACDVRGLTSTERTVAGIEGWILGLP